MDECRCLPLQQRLPTCRLVLAGLGGPGRRSRSCYILALGWIQSFEVKEGGRKGDVVYQARQCSRTYFIQFLGRYYLFSLIKLERLNDLSSVILVPAQGPHPYLLLSSIQLSNSYNCKGLGLWLWREWKGSIPGTFLNGNMGLVIRKQ